MGMTENDMRELAEYQEQAQIREQSQQNNMDVEMMSKNQRTSLEQNANVGIVKEQLELENELIEFEKLLGEKIKTIDEVGKVIWKNPKDMSKVALSEGGIRKLMNTIRAYVTKNTLLSNYDEETIHGKMEDFSNDLNDEIFMSYESYYNFLTPDQIQKRIEESISLKAREIFLNEILMGKNPNIDLIHAGIKSKLNPFREREMIKLEDNKNKLKTHALLMRKIQDMVHSSYLRAWRGMERRTLRQTMSESILRQGNADKSFGSANKKSWLRRGG